MPTPFPGMDPFLENPDLWPGIHNSLIVMLAHDLAPRLRPKYYVAVEERTYLSTPGEVIFAGRPDVSAIGPTAQRSARSAATAVAPAGVVTVELPIPDEITETYLEIRTSDADEVVTVVEVLSPSNKLPGKGRKQYERKRLRLLGTLTHLVEIDLLRAGAPMTMWGDGARSDYRILVSRWLKRPRADLYPFSVRQPIPDFLLPLLPGDEEPVVELNRLLHELYDRAGYDLRIDYGKEPEPPLAEEDRAWAAEVLQGAG